MRALHLIPRFVPALLGLVFSYSGLFKLLHPGGATAALFALGFSLPAASATITAITAVELYLGLILLLKLDLRIGLLAASGILLAFSLFLGYLSTLAHPPSCGCMGMTALFKSNRHNALFGLLRNAALLWCAAWAYGYHFRAPAEGLAGQAPRNREAAG